MEPFGRREGYGNKAEWIVDLTTKADREGKHAHYADRYDASDLRRVNLKELDLQLDRGYRVRPWICAAAQALPSGQLKLGSRRVQLQLLQLGLEMDLSVTNLMHLVADAVCRNKACSHQQYVLNLRGLRRCRMSR